MKDLNQAQKECIRCGKCCERSGPTLHLEDLESIRHIPLTPRHLITIRCGEPVWEPERGLVPVTHELIKIKGQHNSWTCIFYDVRHKACTCYDHRPIECRVLKCWDTKDITALFYKNLLTRSHLINKNSNLKELIDKYDQTCSPYTLLQLLKSKDNKQAQTDLKNLLETDRKFRNQLNKMGIKEEERDFFFGRPLEVLARQLQDS